jgi:ribosomal protein L37E
MLINSRHYYGTRGLRNNPVSFIPRCHRCSHELHREMGMECLHCGSIFPTAGGFNRHRWQVYYREHQFPRSKRTEI